MQPPTKEQYIRARRALFEDTVLDLVEHIIEELIDDPEGQYIESKYTVDEKTVDLVIAVPNAALPLVLGNSNKDLLAAIKKIAFKIANQHGFYLEFNIESY